MYEPHIHHWVERNRWTDSAHCWWVEYECRVCGLRKRERRSGTVV